jgi:uncharacterized protein (TIGR00251 family)
MTTFDFSPYRAQLSQDGEVTLSIRARPTSQKNRIVGVMEDGSIKIDIAAEPEDNKANIELIKFLAEQFGINRQQISIIGGIATRRKIVRITA